MDPVGTPSPNANYILADGPPEVQRLSKQYLWMKHLFNHADAVLPPSVDLSHLPKAKVLDAAAGTAAWALDLAHARAPGLLPLELHASDITLAKFPPEAALQRAGARAFAHDLTRPFPAEMRGTFDVVHMAYLVYALTADAWALALANVCAVLSAFIYFNAPRVVERDADGGGRTPRSLTLEPGGYLILQESDPVIYKPVEDPPPEDGVPHDLERCVDGASVVRRMNAIFAGLALRSGFVVGLSYKLGPLLASASFAVLARERRLAASGRLCARALPAFEQTSVANLSEVFDALTGVLFARGALAGVGSEEERRALVDKIGEEVREGVVVVASEWVARKGGV